jgi:aspartyl-tRNA(Asn)/glutamyl-tRNA(Gln) amidotransferase subunit B
MNAYEPVIGLEVHVQLKTKSKLFCACPAEFGAPPNTNICPICLGYPGSLPVLNRQAFLFGIRIGLALSCQIAERLKFDRKNYFYPDLPKAYQISQYDMPITSKGFLVIDLPQAPGQPPGAANPTPGEAGALPGALDRAARKIGITRAHLEEDAGKLLHEARAGSVVDYNRAGVPLMEIVSEPDLASPEEAHQYLTTLKAILQYIEVSDCDMEKGSLRCDANVSVRKRGETQFGTKVEIKNLNSFSMVKKALEYEIVRQIEAVEKGERIRQETRLWKDEKGITLPMRSKEEAHDYRYFPEPDLVPFTVPRALVEEIRASLTELPRSRRARFAAEYGLSDYDASVLTQEKSLADYFESTVKSGAPPKTASNWIQSEMLARLNKAGRPVANVPVSAADTAGLIRLIQDGTISGKIAKDVYDEMWATAKTAESIVKEKGLVQVTDESVIFEAVKRVIAQNPKPVEDYRQGKEKSFTFLVGQVMKETRGKANPALANKVLKELLEK